jgi:hypothetical protein
MRGPYSRIRWSSRTKVAKGRDRVRLLAIEVEEIAVRRGSGSPDVEDLLGQPAQVLDQADLEHARPRPQLADGQGRHGLVGRDEPHEPLPVQTAVALPDQLQRHRVHAGRAGQVPRGELRQLEVIPLREVVADAPGLGLDEVEVVQQPLGRWRHRLAPVHVLGHHPVGLPKHAGVVLETPDQGPCTLTGAPGEREAGGEALRALLEPLQAQQLAAKRLLGSVAAARAHAVDQASQRHSTLPLAARPRPVRRTPPVARTCVVVAG